MEGFYVGHGSVIVAKKTGVVYETGSAYPTEHYVKAFSACGDPFAELTVNVNVSGWREGANKVSTTKLIKKVSGLGLKEAKNVVDQALTGNPTSFSVSSVEEAKEVVIQIENYGFKCSQLWSTRPSSVMYKKQRKNYDLSI
jgi:ribosomal protein L7/L12